MTYYGFVCPRKRRIEFMLSLPMDMLERMAIQRKVREIGKLK